MRTNYTTIEQVKADDHFSNGVETDVLSAYILYTGGERVEYYVFLNGTVLFKGDDFRPSPLHTIDGIEAIVSLLGFCTVRPGDTDPEYFANYNSEQMAWVESHACEQFKGMISDFENDSEPEYQALAKEYFKLINA